MSFLGGLALFFPWFSFRDSSALQNYYLTNMKISQRAINLILDAEGIDQPSQWPGGGSGITLGYGCDIGADPSSLKFWEGILTPSEISTLNQARGITGRSAKQLATRFTRIKVTRPQSMEVFTRHTLPHEIEKTLATFPCVEKLPNDVLGALVSIVYNRGTSLVGERRREMAEIKIIILAHAEGLISTAKAIKGISAQITAMKRIWFGQGLKGLLLRRDAEARLVLSTLHPDDQ